MKIIFDLDQHLNGKMTIEFNNCEPEVYNVKLTKCEASQTIVGNFPSDIALGQLDEGILIIEGIWSLQS